MSIFEKRATCGQTWPALSSRCGELVGPFAYGNEPSAVDRMVQDLVRPVGGHFQNRLVEAVRPQQDFPYEITAGLRAHLAGLGEPDRNLLTVPIGANTRQEEVAVVAEVPILSTEESEHEGIVAR